MSTDTKYWGRVALMVVITLIIAALALAVAVKEFNENEDQRIQQAIDSVDLGS